MIQKEKVDLPKLFLRKENADMNIKNLLKTREITIKDELSHISLIEYTLPSF